MGASLDFRSALAAVLRCRGHRSDRKIKPVEESAAGNLFHLQMKMGEKGCAYLGFDTPAACIVFHPQYCETHIAVVKNTHAHTTSPPERDTD